MNSVYTSTMIEAAKRRGISIEIFDNQLPVFSLSYGNKLVRCYNGLTDLVGAATFHLAHDKGAANRFLRKFGFPVPNQAMYDGFSKAVDFMQMHESIVVKPVSQWGGRGVSTHISNKTDLRAALTFARRYCDEITLEECVTGVDWRLIFVDRRFICAIQRDAASVYGNGIDTLKTLIMKKNKAARKIDPSNIVPFDRETARCIESVNLTYKTIPRQGEIIVVRRTTNYHTGGTVSIITDKVPHNFINAGERIAKALDIPLLGIDMLVDSNKQSFTIIELSPDMAISPPEGDIVAEAFLDYLFPDSIITSRATRAAYSNFST